MDKKKGGHAIYRPTIGIPCQTNYQTRQEHLVYRNHRAYIRAVESAGGLPVLIPMRTHPSELRDLPSYLDGLLLRGGGDIHPGFYGEQEHPSLNEVDPQLDAFEIALVTWALQRDMPILGICRGMQLINVVLGGTLYQDISTQYPRALEHWWYNFPRTELVHPVTIEKGSLMEQTLRTRHLMVNSFHHQAVKVPGKGICICGWANDGVAELLEAPDYRFVMGVQSHPEEIYRAVPAFARLFQAFINSCYRPSAEPVALFQPIQTFPILQASVRGLSLSPLFGKDFKSSKIA